MGEERFVSSNHTWRSGVAGGGNRGRSAVHCNQRPSLARRAFMPLALPPPFSPSCSGNASPLRTAVIRWIIRLRISPPSVSFPSPQVHHPTRTIRVIVSLISVLRTTAAPRWLAARLMLPLFVIQQPLLDDCLIHVIAFCSLSRCMRNSLNVAVFCSGLMPFTLDALHKVGISQC